LGNKTEAHVRTFFANQNRRYKLNELLKEFENENGVSEEEEENKDKVIYK
jgi:hypothetical protein